MRSVSLSQTSERSCQRREEKEGETRQIIATSDLFSVLVVLLSSTHVRVTSTACKRKKQKRRRRRRRRRSRRQQRSCPILLRVDIHTSILYVIILIKFFVLLRSVLCQSALAKTRFLIFHLYSLLRLFPEALAHQPTILIEVACFIDVLLFTSSRSIRYF